MPLYSGGVFTSPITFDPTLLDLPATYAIGASLEDAYLANPIPSIARMSRINAVARETGGTAATGIGEESSWLQINVAPRDVALMQERMVWISQEDAVAKVEGSGLKKDSIELSKFGVNSVVLDMVIDAKLKERKRQQYIERGTNNILTSGANFAAGVVASLADPVNIASSFIPVVGPARYGRMLAGRSALGRAMVRAQVGTLEGIAGAALTEPLTLAAANSEQLDYGTTDSLMNLAFGSVLGGGLHMGFGALGDMVSINARTDTDAILWNSAEADQSFRGFERPQGGTSEYIQKGMSYTEREDILRSVIGSLADGRRLDPEVLVAIGRQPGPDAKFSLGDLNFRIDADGTVKVLDGVTESDRLATIFKQSLPIELRNRIEAGGVEDFASIVKSYVDEVEGVSAKVAMDLLEVQGKKKPKTLSEFLEESGGIAVIDAQDLKYNIRNRPGLFKGDGMRLDKAYKLAKDAGYIEPKMNKKAFRQKLESDLYGNAVLRPDDAKAFQETLDLVKSKNVSDQIEGRIRALSERFTEDSNTVMRELDRQFHSEEALDTYDPQARAESQRVMREIPEDPTQMELDDLRNMIAESGDEARIQEINNIVAEEDAYAQNLSKSRTAMMECIIGTLR